MPTSVSSSTGVSHEWLIRFTEHRIGDRSVIRLIRKWLTAGTLEEVNRRQRRKAHGCGHLTAAGKTYTSTTSSICGASVATSLCHRQVVMVRYADDIVIGFDKRYDARRLHSHAAQTGEFGSRFTRKTRLMEFGRFAAENRAIGEKGKPETFIPRVHAHQREKIERKTAGSC
ncbi:hypothetical protein FC642_27200 (plasmid) [Klebsiella pneumoniae]|nr:hypothetical protein FC642_27200 [Klebsiella pneumoniae]